MRSDVISTHRPLLRHLGTACLVVCLACVAYGDEPPPVRIGFWSLEGALTDPDTFANTIAYLDQEIADRAVEAVPLAYDELLAAMDADELDFVCVDPAVYVELEAKYGAERMAVVRHAYNGQPYAVLGGTVFCARDKTDIITVEHLRNRTVAASHPKSFGSWLAISSEMRERRMQPHRFFWNVQFLGSEEGVVRAVLGGKVEAGSVRSGLLERMAAEGELDLEDIRILTFHGSELGNALEQAPVAHTTRFYPSWCLAACRKAPDELKNRVAALLLAMPGPASPAAGRPSHAGWTIPHSMNTLNRALQTLWLHPYQDVEVTMADFLRRYMYWFILAGSAVVIMIVVTSYVAHLNTALRSEIGVRKQAETSLRESIERFEAIGTCSADWIWETDHEGRFTYSSGMVHGMLGYDSDEILGKRQHELLTTTDKEKLQSRVQEVRERKEGIFRERYKLVTKEGRVVIHESTAEPVLDSRGNLLGYRGVNRDVTDQVRFIRL